MVHSKNTLPMFKYIQEIFRNVKLLKQWRLKFFYKGKWSNWSLGVQPIELEFDQLSSRYHLMFDRWLLYLDRTSTSWTSVLKESWDFCTFQLVEINKSTDSSSDSIGWAVFGSTTIIFNLKPFKQVWKTFDMRF